MDISKLNLLNMWVETEQGEVSPINLSDGSAAPVETHPIAALGCIEVCLSLRDRRTLSREQRCSRHVSEVRDFRLQHDVLDGRVMRKVCSEQLLAGSLDGSRSSAKIEHEISQRNRRTV